MRKDKKWLKEKADRLFFDNSMSNNPYLVAKREAITEISNLIDQLDEPEVLSQKWIDEHKWDNDHIWKPFVCVEDLKNLLVPKQELPVIPRWVADNIESKKRVGTRLNVAMSEFPEFKLEKELDIDEHECNEIYARAWLDGFTIASEDEQKYYVLDSEDIPLLERANNQTYKTTTTLSIHEDGRDNSKFELTEQEIKDYDERYFAFAVKVEELEI